MQEAIDITIKLLSPTVANGDINGIAWAFYMAIGAVVLTGIFEFIEERLR